MAGFVGPAEVLSSDWDGLNSNLIARIWAVERYTGDDGKKSFWRRIDGTPEVQTFITEGVVDTSVNWHSPFENMGADQKFSALSALLQTGTLAPLFSKIAGFLKSEGEDPALSVGAAAAVKSLEGRSSVTKLNSTQVFNGSAPTKLTFTAHFRAISDPVAEVHRPMDQLMAWALPQELAEDGPLLSLLNAGDPSLYPSKIPQTIAVQYAGSLYSPMVIEAAPYPLTGPRDRLGRLLNAQMNLSIATLRSLDAPAWRSAQQNIYSKQ